MTTTNKQINYEGDFIKFVMMEAKLFGFFEWIRTQV